MHPAEVVARGIGAEPVELLVAEPERAAQFLGDEAYAGARNFENLQRAVDTVFGHSYVCPAHIPLVHYYRYAKTEIWTLERERKKSDLARRRHDARQARLERLERERKARLRKKKEALDKKPGANTGASKKAAIEAAMKRVAAKKAAQQAEAQTPGGE